MNQSITVVDQRLDEIRDGILLHLKRQWEDVLIVGELATEAKTLLPHGEYENWVRTSLGVSPQMIGGYRRIYERFSDKSKKFFDLPFSAALPLASPSLPEGVFQEIETRLQAGEKVTVEAVENVITQYKVLQAAQVGSRAILEQFGTTPNGQPAKTIPASAVRSLDIVATEGLNHGVVEIEGEAYPISQPLPTPVVVATEAETNRRRAGHIEDSTPAMEIVVNNVRVPVAALIINDCVTFRIPGIGSKLSHGEVVRVKITREVA